MARQKWRSSVAVLMVLGLSTATVAPIAMLEQSAMAGIFAQSGSSGSSSRDRDNGSSRDNGSFRDSDSSRDSGSSRDVLSGTRIRVEEKDGKKIVLGPDETFAATLVATEEVRSNRGTVLIPRGTEIEGEFRPARNEAGTQFIARRIIFRDGTERNLNASSNIVNTRKKISKGVNVGPIWQGALVGGGASAIISSIVSDVGIFKVLGGAGAGALAGWLIAGRKKTEVIVIEPSENLELTLDSDLALSNRY
jgi:hypothetical protein